MPPFSSTSLRGGKRTFLNLKTNCSTWGLVFQRQTFIQRNELLFLTGWCLKDNAVLKHAPVVPDMRLKPSPNYSGAVLLSNSNISSLYAAFDHDTVFRHKNAYYL